MAFSEIITKCFTVGESETDPALLNDHALVGITVTGSHITGSEITFLVSSDNANYYPLYDTDSAEVSITTGSYARSYALYFNNFLLCNYVKAREGSSASPVNQTVRDIDINFHVGKIT